MPIPVFRPSYDEREEAAVVRVLRKAGKPVILAANKVDDQRAEAEAATLWNLGLGEPFSVSALHGRGSGDLLDAVQRMADDELRSLNGQIEFLLREAVRQRGREKTA